MSLPSGLNYDFIKTVATVLCPGALAISPYCVIVAKKWKSVSAYTHDNPTLALSVLLLMVIGMGMILEDIGSEIESGIFDKGSDAKERQQSWDSYLRLAFDKEPVGHRYLRTVVARMKFEISMFCAIPFFYIGLIWLQSKGHYISCANAVLGSFLILGAFVFFVYEANSSSKLLSDVRKKLLEGVTVVGVPDKK